mmetsp:Transcript_111496/g.296329  ORF Transcript_111496/g.296329 Transcript_111496/m.296329 type:complete len:377 (-) Transcript_111496:115-1245(-)
MAPRGLRATTLRRAPLLLSIGALLGCLPAPPGRALVAPLERGRSARCGSHARRPRPGRRRVAAQVAVADEVRTVAGVEQEGSDAEETEKRQAIAEQIEDLERRAAEEDADALFKLGRAFRRGAVVDRNITRAFELIQAAAELGHAEAQCLAGLMIYKGQAPGADSVEALSYLTEAAEAGLAKAQFNAAMLYHEGVGLEEPDLVAHAYWLKRAADGGHAQAQYRLGDLLLSGAELKKNETWAAQYLEPAAEQGHVRAQEAIGLMYRTGTGVELDTETAAGWLTKAAQDGDALSAYTLGCMIRVGESGGRPDPELALYWLTKAADQGHIQAAEDLAVMLLSGEGTEPDEQGSAYWFMHAEEWRQQIEGEEAGYTDEEE